MVLFEANNESTTNFTIIARINVPTIVSDQ